MKHLVACYDTMNVSLLEKVLSSQGKCRLPVDRHSWLRLVRIHSCWLVEGNHRSLKVTIVWAQFVMYLLLLFHFSSDATFYILRVSTCSSLFGGTIHMAAHRLIDRR